VLIANYVLSIDQGTTGTTVMVVDEAIGIRASVNREFEQLYPQPGWVEHDPEAIWASVTTCIGDAIAAAGIAATDIAAIGITNQRETTLLWERSSGRMLHNAIVWQDRRTAEHCERLKSSGLEPLYRDRTGLVLDPYFSGTKASWLLDHVDPQRQRSTAGELALGTVDSFLIWRLTGGQAHVTDPSNASRTLLFDIQKMAWDAELTAPLNVPMELLPEVRGSSEVYGVTKDVPGLPDGIPVAGAAGDQQAALFGQACFDPGDAKCTYGTGAFLLVNTGAEVVHSQNGMLATVAWKLRDQVTYALEGSVFVAGSAVQWLRDGLSLVREAAEIEALAETVPDTGGVVFVPALVGLGAPHWRPDARGMITGITRGTTAAHLARATLEGIALQVVDLAQAMAADFGRPLGTFRVDGGAAANDLLMQMQADTLGMAIVRPAVIETTGLGAAFLAGLAAGVWGTPQAIADAWQPDRSFAPEMSAAARADRLAAWRRAVEKV